MIPDLTKLRKFFDNIQSEDEFMNMDNFEYYKLYYILKEILKEDGDSEAALISKWFEKGRESVLRTNKSGCCCIIENDDTVTELCAAHKEYIDNYRAIKEVKE